MIYIYIYQHLQRGAKWFRYRVSLHHPLGFKDGTPTWRCWYIYIYIINTVIIIFYISPAIFFARKVSDITTSTRHGWTRFFRHTSDSSESSCWTGQNCTRTSLVRLLAVWIWGDGTCVFMDFAGGVYRLNLHTGEVWLFFWGEFQDSGQRRSTIRWRSKCIKNQLFLWWGGQNYCWCSGDSNQGFNHPSWCKDFSSINWWCVGRDERLL